MDLVDRLLKGDRRAAAKAISMLEDDDRRASEILGAIYPHTGDAHIIGITGPTGTGKSTLVFALTKEFRRRGMKVGIVAIDPTSPYTGGALLGDRIRMGGLTLDEGVFIRSMGTRGHTGGTSRSTADVLKVLDAMGMQKIFAETAGAGQSEVEIAKIAHTSVVVEMPGLGDDIQAMKAGILEIGDIFVINKADLDGVDSTLANLSLVIEQEKPSGWKPKIQLTVATEDKGVPELADLIEEHFEFLKKSGRLEEEQIKRAKDELRTALSRHLFLVISEKPELRAQFEELVGMIAKKEIDPHTAARKIFGKTSM
ncbi:MAG: methylmalonyl Co-A mutase-associated GTPase MeaB [Thermoplasmata archaeon]